MALQWNAKSHGTPLGYRIFMFFIKHCGLRFAYVNLTYVVLHFVLFYGKPRRCIWYYYRQIFGYGRLKSMWLVYLHFYRFGQTIVDKLAITCGYTKEFNFEFANYDEFLNILNSNRGVLMIGAHVGEWEAGAPFFGDYGKKIHIVMYDADYQRIKEAMERDANEKNYNIIPINKDSLEAVLTIKYVLDAGEYVCMLGDRFIDDEHKIETTFMGHKADFPEGPFLLASKLGVPVVFYFSMREKMGYKFHFYMIKSDEKPRTKAYQQDILNQYVAQLENIVRQYPQQWFNMYKFWK